MNAETRGKGFFKSHPAGLGTLFFTEMWERFSFYGMKALLLLFMLAAVEKGGLELGQERASLIYGLYGAAVYFMAMPGGLIGDRLLGPWHSVLVGGIVIAIGHFTMIFHGTGPFYAALLLIVLGTGLLKPNITRLVGSLYSKDDKRSDSGFAIYYMGINVGATLAPLVCGFLAQSSYVQEKLAAHGLDPNLGWHLGFAAAGVGMLFGILQLVLHKNRFANFALQQEEKSSAVEGNELSRMAVIAILFFFSALFWAVYEQGGASLNVFAAEHVRAEIFGLSFPSTWFQSFQAVFVLVLTPVFAQIWLVLGRKNREPGSPIKFALGLFALGCGIAVAVPAVLFAASSKVSPLWLAAIFFLEVVGEMMFSPVGLRTVDQLAPRRFAGLTLGIWFMSVSLGAFLSGYLSSFYDADCMSKNAWLFAGMAIALMLASAALALLSPRLRKLMGNVR